MNKNDFQPLLDKITNRFNSWTARHLSFAGRLQLLQSVIYSTISFWASIFILPNQCVRLLEQTCNAFLWSGAPNSAKGAKISWQSVCTPKAAGGLGLRSIGEWNKVLGLKLIWLIFAAGGSLWVSWVRRNLIGQEIFWNLVPNGKGSWIWHTICKLRPLAYQMIVCKVGSGLTASFWHDNWTDLGLLIEITGVRGPIVTGLPFKASVADGLVNGGWWIEGSRSRNPISMMLRQCLPDPSGIAASEIYDRYLWRPLGGKPSTKFSSSITWKAMHPMGPPVFWHKKVWFKGRIPKHAFLTWVVVRDRLVTRDRLRRWGILVPGNCLLCDIEEESKQHLFFDCSFSREVWTFLCTRFNLTSPNLFKEKLRWLRNHTVNKNVLVLTKLLFQASVYCIWKERNARLHTGIARQPQALIEDIKRIILLRLDSLSQTLFDESSVTLLSTWVDSS